MKNLSALNLENYLYRLDLYFKEKTKKDIFILYFLVFCGMFFISYSYFWNLSEDMFLENKKKVIDVTSKINNDKTFLRDNPKSKIDLLDKDIRVAKIRLKEIKNSNLYIKKELEGISSLFYDEKIWGAYLHSISLNGKKYNVKILDFTNNSVVQNSSFGHILDIAIKFTGNFNNSLKFINSLERSDLVVDIHSFDMEATDRLNTDINLSVWGIVNR